MYPLMQGLSPVIQSAASHLYNGIDHSEWSNQNKEKAVHHLSRSPGCQHLNFPFEIVIEACHSENESFGE